jgi:hypothetical protein
MLSLMGAAALQLGGELVLLVSATTVLPSYKTSKHVLWLRLSDAGKSKFLYQPVK